jgi:hypothetical protein
MGRPIKKSKMIPNFGGSSTSGKIAVTAYRPFGGAKVDSTTAYLVAQRSSRKFKIHLEDSTEEVMMLKAVAPGSLANDNASGLGEFCIKITLDDSTTAYVERIYNNTVHYVESDGTTTGSVPYSQLTEATDESKVSGVGVIDVL